MDDLSFIIKMIKNEFDFNSQVGNICLDNTLSEYYYSYNNNKNIRYQVSQLDCDYG